MDNDIVDTIEMNESDAPDDLDLNLAKALNPAMKSEANTRRKGRPKSSDVVVRKDTVKLTLSQKQSQFIKADGATEILFSGGVRAGKSYAGCVAVLQQASIPGNVVFIIRKTLASLKKSTLQTLKEIMPNRSYKHHLNDSYIDIKGGGRIYLLPMSNAERIKSMEAGSIFIDEVTELEKDEYIFLKTRLSNKKGNQKIYCTCNPASTKHWVYKYFIENPIPSVKYIHITTQENKFLSDSYIENQLGSLDSETKLRLVAGEWMNASGLVFKNFYREKVVRDFDNYAVSGFHKLIAAVDFGQTHPSAMLLAGIKKNEKKENQVWILQEFKKSGALMHDILSKIREWATNFTNIDLYYDPAAPLIANECKNINIEINKANNDVRVSIAGIRSGIELNNLFIHPTCTEIVTEMENYAYKSDYETIDKNKDDCIDCLRYIYNALSKDAAQYLYPTIYRNPTTLQYDSVELTDPKHIVNLDNNLSNHSKTSQIAQRFLNSSKHGSLQLGI
ncbi:MAG: hypothetical protein RLY43_802 [Bacteroidota bacterium]